MADPGGLRSYLQVPLFGKNYARKLINLFGQSSVLGLWPLDEASGSIAYDVSGNNRHASYSGPTLANAAGPRGKPAPLFDGVNDYVNLYSASLDAAFNKSACTMLIWSKVLNADVWSDASNDFAFSLYYNTTNYARLIKLNTTGNFQIFCYFDSVAKAFTVATGSPTTWFHAGLTWDNAADQVKGFFNGAQIGSTLTGMGVMAANPISTGYVIAGQVAGGGTTWNGWLAYALLLNRAATPTEIAAAYNTR